MPKQFTWNAVLERAAARIARGDQTHDEIGKDLGVSSRTLERWKQEPEFIERVEGLVKQWRATVMTRGIAIRENRMAGYNRTADLLERVRSERAADPALQRHPGGKTGLIVRDLKVLTVAVPETVRTKNGRLARIYVDRAQLIEELKLDTGWLKEKRELEKQASIECGDWDGEFQPQRQQQVVVLTLPGLSVPDVAPVPLDPKAQLR